MPKTQASSSTNSPTIPSFRSTDHRALQRCLEWRLSIPSSTSLSDYEEGAFPETPADEYDRSWVTPRLGLNDLTALHHINPKVAHAIENMNTSEEARRFLDVAHDIRAERAAELALLQQQLERSRREVRSLESKMAAALGRVVGAERGIASMRLLMSDKGLLDDQEPDHV